MIQRSCRRPGLALFLVVALTANATFAATWYVDPDTTIPVTQKVCSVDEATPCGTDADCSELELGSCILLPGSTTSWCNAAISLQDVLNSAGLNDTIKVADGTYWPDPTGLGDPRDATFRLPSTRVTIEGGYAGCGAASPDERDFIAFESILSGDIGVPDDSSDNCFHVVTGSGSDATVILDGLTITAGNADGGSLVDGTGGGMLNEQGSPTVRNCTFRWNYANRGGGGVLNRGDSAAQSAPQFTNCIFDGNVVTGTGPAGGAFNLDSAPTFTNCLFIRNRSNRSWGGAMHSDKVENSLGSKPTLRNSTFAGNFALSTQGGGLSFQNSTAIIIDCVIWGNCAGAACDTEEAQLALFSGPDLLVDYSDVQGCKTGTDDICEAPTDNIGDDPFLDDPRFVPGPIGCYYLGDTAAGEPFDSACIDSGSDLATNIPLGNGTFADRTTQSGEALDTGTVDMGYHYPDTAAPVDPETGLKFLLGDQNRDGVVDLLDYDEFAACLTDPGVGEVTPCCRIFDYELDGDVDLQDFAEFQMSFFPP